jgi:autotransporter adhesin
MGHSTVATNDSATAMGYLTTAGGKYSVAMGGGSKANGESAIAMGASANASGNYSVAMGYITTAGGVASLAAGNGAQAGHNGAFVWSDGSAATASGAANQFVARASGGFFFYSSSAGVGVKVDPGGNAWSQISDRNMKENFIPVDSRTMLEKVVHMPVTEWNLITQDPAIRHVGPMAQDFKAAFGLGTDERYIGTSDADGVAFAAIQGLNQKLESEVKEKDAKIGELEKRLDALETIIRHPTSN